MVLDWLFLPSKVASYNKGRGMKILGVPKTENGMQEAIAW